MLLSRLYIRLLGVCGTSFEIIERPLSTHRAKSYQVPNARFRPLAGAEKTQGAGPIRHRPAQRSNSESP